MIYDDLSMPSNPPEQVDAATAVVDAFVPAGDRVEIKRMLGII